MIETVPGLLRAAASRWQGRAALKSMREPAASFEKLDHFADRFAKALIADGMEAGERIALWAPNSWEWVATAVGVQRAGGTLVPLNLRLRAAEVADILARAGVTRLVLVEESHSIHLPGILRRDKVPLLQTLIVLRPVAAMPGPHQIAWEDFLAKGDSVTDAHLHEREAGVTGDTLSDILFTSGTTGRPKGAVFTHRSSVLSGHGMVNFARVTDSDCLCPLGPFSHFAGYKGGWVNGLVSGATVCWSDGHDSQSILEAIQTMRVTAMPAPPVVWQDVLDRPDRADWDLSTLRFIATGSTVIPPVLVRRLISELAIDQVGTGYGLTESGGMTTFTRRDDPVESVAETAGTAAPDAEIRIVGPEGQPLGLGESGEILVRTQRAMLEYLDDPEATQAALEGDGWLHTGDVGSLHGEGYLRVTDRLKDMYITNGFNVYPAEIERLMSDIAGIAQCAVVGVPEVRRGEVGHAFIVRAPGMEVSESEIIEWCRTNIAGYKVPVGITFVDELPRNSQGKVLKSELRALT